jgi:hypothetical protein
MAGKKLTMGGGVAAFVAAFGLIFKETVGWFVGKILDFLPLPKDAVGAVNWSAIPWLDMLAFALLALGVYLFWRGGKMQSLRPKSSEETSLIYLQNAGENMIDRLRDSRRAPWDDPLVDIILDARSLLLSFKKVGFQTPVFGNVRAEQEAFGLIVYFVPINSLLKEGHKDEARQQSQSISDNAGAQCAAFQWGKWRDPAYSF